MAKRAIWLGCILSAWAGLTHALSPAPANLPPAAQGWLVKVQSQNGLSGPDQSASCAAAGGLGTDTDCRRNGVQIDPNSGQALDPDDQCTSIGGTIDGEACFRDGTQIDPDTGDDLQPGDPNYEPQAKDDNDQQDQTGPDQDQEDQDETAPPDQGDNSGKQDSSPPDTSSDPPSSSDD